MKLSRIEVPCGSSKEQQQNRPWKVDLTTLREASQTPLPEPLTSLCTCLGTLSLDSKEAYQINRHFPISLVCRLEYISRKMDPTGRHTLRSAS